MNWVRYANSGATRNLPLSERMYGALDFLPELGVTMEVFSGGQPAKGTSDRRVGSTRHDHGHAADVFFYKDGRRLDWSNPEDLPLFEEIVRRGRANGLTGFGAGDGYMQPGSMHIGFGNEAVWGAGGKGANAPGWLRSAYYGADAPARETLSTNSPAVATAGLALTPSLIPGMDQEAPQMQDEEPISLFGQLFGLSGEREDQLRANINGLVHRPNVGLQRTLESRMGERAQGRERQEQAAQAQQQANRTAQWLASQPGGQRYAQAIASGALPAGEALQMWRQESQGQEPTALMQNVEFIMQQNPGISMQEALQLAKSGTTVNVNSGSEVGTIPPGHELFTDPETGARRMRPIAGSPAYVEQQQAAAAETQRQQSATDQQNVRDTVVGRDVDRLVSMIDRNGFFDLPETGLLGGLLGNRGVNQEAVDFKNTLEGIQATVAFDRLQQMREASKTGGALGAVSERELDLLIGAYGALKQNTSGPILKENLLTLKRIMTKIENDPVASAFYFGTGQGGTAQSGGFSITGRVD